MAFVVGANVTIHRSDVGRARDILRKGIADRDKLYKPYFESLAALHD